MINIVFTQYCINLCNGNLVSSSRSGKLGRKMDHVPHFYNFYTGIGFFPYKLILLNLCGPPDLSAFLYPCSLLLFLCYLGLNVSNVSRYEFTFTAVYYLIFVPT